MPNEILVVSPPNILIGKYNISPDSHPPNCHLGLNMEPTIPDDFDWDAFDIDSNEGLSIDKPSSKFSAESKKSTDAEPDTDSDAVYSRNSGSSSSSSSSDSHSDSDSSDDNNGRY